MLKYELRFKIFYFVDEGRYQSNVSTNGRDLVSHRSKELYSVFVLLLKSFHDARLQDPISLDYMNWITTRSQVEIDYQRCFARCFCFSKSLATSYCGFASADVFEWNAHGTHFMDAQ